MLYQINLLKAVFISKDQYKKLFIITLFGIAFGYLEASVVVYLRELYYPDGFNLPIKLGFPYIYFGTTPYLQPIPLKILLIELGREAATICMLLTLAISAGRNIKERIAYFLWPFAVWDIFYYIFLKLLLNWPASLGTIDVLFLIPVPWIAPVWMPVLASCIMLIISLYFLNKTNKS